MHLLDPFWTEDLHANIHSRTGRGEIAPLKRKKLSKFRFFPAMNYLGGRNLKINIEQFRYSIYKDSGQ